MHPPYRYDFPHTQTFCIYRAGLGAHDHYHYHYHYHYQMMPALSVAWLAHRTLTIGLEYRRMPNNLQDAGNAAGLGDGLRSQDWKEVFIAWAPSKTVSLTFAVVDLGLVVPANTANRTQTGGYLSVQFVF